MSSSLGNWFQVLGVLTGSAIALSANRTIAQITPDATLPNNSRVITQRNIKIIEGGTQLGNNLFHSFEQFSLPTGTTAYFNNTFDTQNIISRVTGKSISNIDGTLKANGTANLFLINPNGIVFGPNAALNIGGSFLATTANSINFADGSKFSATATQTTPLLTVSVPVGLQFGATANPIRNRSRTPASATNIFNRPVGLQVQSGKTLALVGGDLTLEGGTLTAPGGQIVLASVGANSLVNLSPNSQGWQLSYEGVPNFQNILIADKKIPSFVNTGNEGGGNIYIQGKRVTITGNSQIFTTSTSSQPTGNLTVTASELVELSATNACLVVTSLGSGQIGNLTINTKNLIVRNGAQVFISGRGSGSGGKLTVNASESVELTGGYLFQNGIFLPSGLFSATFATGDAGDITINTGKLRVQGGAQISTQSSGLRLFPSRQFLPATGKGGNLTVNASQSVEVSGTSLTGISSNLSASTQGYGAAGNVTLNTKQLIVRDEGTIAVNSQLPNEYIYLGDPQKLGKAGELNINARSILLDNKGLLASETDVGNGGNIKLQVRDLLLMRRNSQITTNAGGLEAAGDGGNIKIDAPGGFIVAAPDENNDITANAFSGSGGRIEIKSAGIFNFEQRSRQQLANILATKNPSQLDPQILPTNDITAISQTNPNLSGQVNLNVPDTDPSRGLVELPIILVDPSQLIATSCTSSGEQSKSSFIVTGRGGIVPSPAEPLLPSDEVLVHWIDLLGENAQNGWQRANGSGQEVDVMPSAAPIVEAQGWVVNAKGEIILVANAPNITPDGALSSPASCYVGLGGKDRSQAK